MNGFLSDLANLLFFKFELQIPNNIPNKEKVQREEFFVHTTLHNTKDDLKRYLPD